jgi:hypothetical protein
MLQLRFDGACSWSVMKSASYRPVTLSHLEHWELQVLLQVRPQRLCLKEKQYPLLLAQLFQVKSQVILQKSQNFSLDFV